jgi:uncharacterized membrane protein HdeD (DUF308 family)
MTLSGPGGGEAASISDGGGGASSGAPPAGRLWQIPAIRGAIAVVLGVLAVAAGSDRAAMVNFLGTYWLFSAVLTIAWALRARWKPGSRLGLLAGIIGLVAALLVLGRHVLAPVVSARFLVDAFGVSAVLTGTLRLAGAFEVERRTGRWWTFGGLALGSVEIVLGAIVLYSGQDNLRLVTAAVGAWGLIGGTLLLLEGFKIRRSLRPH